MHRIILFDTSARVACVAVGFRRAPGAAAGTARSLENARATATPGALRAA